MVELHRVVQSQMASRYSQQATSNKESADALDQLLEDLKPPMPSGHEQWDLLIATPFRYPLPTDPQYEARFKPPHFHRNVWYGSELADTAFYEASYHLLKQRIHLPNHNETGLRTLFVVDCDLSKALDVRGSADIAQIMDRQSYAASHKVAQSANSYTGIIYPSCREPKGSMCAAMYELSCFSKVVKNELTVHFEYQHHVITWTRHPSISVSINWSQIS